MLFKHWVLLFYECVIAILFVYLTLDDSYCIFDTSEEENTTAKYAHVFMNLTQTNSSQ